jgi:hypothetical protein
LQDYNIRHYIIRRARDSFRANRAASGADASRLVQEVRRQTRAREKGRWRDDATFGGDSARGANSALTQPLPAPVPSAPRPLAQGASSLALIHRQSTIAGFYVSTEPSVMEQWEARTKGGAAAGAGRSA